MQREYLERFETTIDMINILCPNAIVHLVFETIKYLTYSPNNIIRPINLSIAINQQVET